jgi:hypothetical protein
MLTKLSILFFVVILLMGQIKPGCGVEPVDAAILGAFHQAGLYNQLANALLPVTNGNTAHTISFVGWTCVTSVSQWTPITVYLFGQTVSTTTNDIYRLTQILSTPAVSGTNQPNWNRSTSVSDGPLIWTYDYTQISEGLCLITANSQ